MRKQFHPALAAAIKLIEGQEYDNAIKALIPFMHDKDLELQAQALNFIGTCYFHMGDYAQAIIFYEEVCATSDNCTYWFNVAMTSALNRNTHRALQAFEQAIIYAKEQRFREISKFRCYFAQALIGAQEYEYALIQLNYLWESYMYYRITDPTFLDLRGMPFFTNFLSVALAVLNGLGDKFDGHTWLAILNKHVDEDGQEQIKKIMSQLTAPEYSVNSSHEFKIPLPLEISEKPMKAVIETVEPNQDSEGKFILCRVYEGILKPQKHIILKKNNGKILNGYIEKLESFRNIVYEVKPNDMAVLYFSEISPDEFEVGDFIEYDLENIK